MLAQLKRTLFTLGFLAFSGCNLWAPARPMLLPASIERVASGGMEFRVYRYPIHGLSPSALAKIDAFGRGLDDVLVANSDSSTVTLFRNEGDGTMKEYGTWSTCPSPAAVDGEDINGDGHADILVTCTDHAMLTLLTGDGHGHFERHDFPAGAHPISAQVAPHVVMAGTPYLAVLSDSPSTLELYYRQRSGLFTPGKALLAPESPSAMVADIFTRDAAISYAVTSQTQSKVSVYLKNGGSFDRTDYDAPESPGQFSAFDLRGQETVDLVVASSTQNLFRLYLNDGTGHFEKTRDYVLPHGPAGGIGSSHLRGSAQSEIVFQSAQTGEIIIYPNIGDGTLGNPEVLSVGASLTGLITGHFAHQADDMDVALIDSMRGQLIILLNEHQSYQ